MDKLKAPGKPFGISKRAVWEAWEKGKHSDPRVDDGLVAVRSDLSRRSASC